MLPLRTGGLTQKNDTGGYCNFDTFRDYNESVSTFRDKDDCYPYIMKS